MRRSTGSVQTARRSPASAADSTATGAGSTPALEQEGTRRASDRRRTASTTISATRWSPPTAAPAPSATTMPRNSPPDPTAMPVGRDRCRQHPHHAGDGVEHERLRDRDQQLPGQRPAEAVAAEPHDAAERGQHDARAQREPRAAVQGQTGRHREHDVEQREDVGQPADRGHRDAVVLGRRRRHRRVGEPQQLRRARTAA